jgi:ubiquitin carboxyl-terminal hydrolase 8
MQMSFDGLSGLANLGNTCYMNSVIHALSHSTTFNQYLISNKNQNDIVISAYIRLFTEIWKNNEPLSPRSFKLAINKKLDKYSGVNKEDASEFLIDLLEYFHENISRKKSVIIDSEPTLSNRHLIKAKKSWNTFFKNKKTIISDLFYGQYQEKYVCRICSNQLRTYDPFSSLILTLTTNTLLKTAVQEHFENTTISLSCEECCKSQNTTIAHDVTKEIFKSPEILIISLNKCNLNITVEIPEILDLTDVISISHDTLLTTSTYKVTSIICHSNSHYYTLVNKSGKWFKIDDTIVSEVEYPDPKHSHTIFYSKIQKN